jgi:hypothetical protein
MNTKHTPGPWRVQRFDRCHEETGSQHGIQVCAADETVICCNETYYPTGLREENAALIAAAPELLTAAKGALAALSQSKTFPADIEAAKAFLRDAIAKAND